LLPRMHEFAHQCLLGYFLGSRNHLQPRRHHGHRRKINVRQKTRFCTRMCVLEVAKPKFNIYAPFPPKTAILGPYLDGTSKFSAEKSSNIRDAKSKRPLNVIVAP